MSPLHSTSSSCKEEVGGVWCAFINRGATAGSLCTSKWNTCGCSVCCKTCNKSFGCPQTATALPKWSTPFSRSPAASSSSPNWISCRKNFCTASWFFMSGNTVEVRLPDEAAAFFALRPEKTQEVRKQRLYNLKMCYSGATSSWNRDHCVSACRNRCNSRWIVLQTRPHIFRSLFSEKPLHHTPKLLDFSVETRKKVTLTPPSLETNWLLTFLFWQKAKVGHVTHVQGVREMRANKTNDLSLFVFTLNIFKISFTHLCIFFCCSSLQAIVLITTYIHYTDHFLNCINFFLMTVLHN